MESGVSTHGSDRRGEFGFTTCGMDDLHTLLINFLQPYVTIPSKEGKLLTILTWAQSLDAKIAPATRVPMALSSLETKYMTHLIRRQVDAILIGAETAVGDNPGLNGYLVFHWAYCS